MADVLGMIGTLGAAAISSAASMYINRQNIKYAEGANRESVELANTAHQREIRDLEAAGLNPILSASSSGSSIPQLRTPNLQSIDGGIGNSAGTLARQLNGLASAQVDSAESNAKTDRAYADRAQEMAAAEVSSANAQNDVAHSHAKVLEAQSYADRIEELARIEALQGHRPGEVDALIPKGRDGVYRNLVQKFKNEIETGRYKSSIERQFTSDLLSGASSAGQVFRATRGTKGKRP